MKKLFILSLVMVFLAGTLMYAYTPGPAAGDDKAKVKKEGKKDPTVYVKEKGKKYHKKNCKTVAEGKKGMKLSEAIKKGYTPCALCKPVEPPKKKKKKK